MTVDWGYEESNGPSVWPQFFPQAAGSLQSPVNIETTKATNDTTLKSKPLYWNYSPDICKQIDNNGYGWKVQVYDDGDGSELSGGPLGHKYKLEQFHCHWGCTSTKGSEHTVDGVAYAGELHLVHWNCDKYNSFYEAIDHPDGLAVVGVFLKAGDKCHQELEKIVSHISQVALRNQSAPIANTIDPAALLPEDVTYWTYHGSLTTPPCSECVTWIMFKNPIEVSERQLNAFRSMRMKTPEECSEPHGGPQLVNNYRPPLPLGNRVLRECGAM
ncbi:carbonic anhydrase 2 [Adelges cooleyi]|uniref:carbonic anhydrase 2 n=1 Tax=Adelges cooleyi TaxID=133065 RepID=UPI00217F7FD0|nr:carbonic anhydrase 2 [Adelges cooleyi]